MAYEEINWRCDDHDLTIGLDRAGKDPTVLLLPALSSVSTRREMRPLQERLAQSFTTMAQIPRSLMDRFVASSSRKAQINPAGIDVPHIPSAPIQQLHAQRSLQ